VTPNTLIFPEKSQIDAPNPSVVPAELTICMSADESKTDLLIIGLAYNVENPMDRRSPSELVVQMLQGTEAPLPK
jgi:hypothetical protein